MWWASRGRLGQVGLSGGAGLPRAAARGRSCLLWPWSCGSLCALSVGVTGGCALCPGREEIDSVVSLLASLVGGLCSWAPCLRGHRHYRGGGETVLAPTAQAQCCCCGPRCRPGELGGGTDGRRDRARSTGRGTRTRGPDTHSPRCSGHPVQGCSLVPQAGLALPSGRGVARGQQGRGHALEGARCCGGGEWAGPGSE